MTIAKTRLLRIFGVALITLGVTCGFTTAAWADPTPNPTTDPGFSVPGGGNQIADPDPSQTPLIGEGISEENPEFAKKPQPAAPQPAPPVRHYRPAPPRLRTAPVAPATAAPAEVPTAPAAASLQAPAGPDVKDTASGGKIKHVHAATVAESSGMPLGAIIAFSFAGIGALGIIGMLLWRQFRKAPLKD